MRKWFVPILVVIVLQGFVEAGKIDGLLGSPAMKNVRFGVLAVRADDGCVLYSKNADAMLIPASNMKLLSSSAALHYLGPEYQFQTQIGLLNGSLVIIGGGDPLLADAETDGRYGRPQGWVLSRILETLQKNGVREVADIIVDPSFFDSNRVHSAWPADQLNQWYACEISGLNYNANCIHITASRSNGRISVATVPTTEFITFINQIRPVSQGSSAIGAYRNSKPNVLILKGNLNTQVEFDVAIENPAAYLAVLIKEKLTASGIAVRGNLIQKYCKADSQIRILDTISTPISDVLYRSNKDSLGLAAETFIKTMSAENTSGRINGEWEHGLSLVGRYLGSLDIDPNSVVLNDGSGLSRQNRLTVSAIIAVLRDAYQKPYWPLLEQSLAVGGVDGTVSKYFHGPQYKGKILCKTGYISGVRALSGVCKTPSGDILFSILTEGGGSAVRQTINEITQAIFDGQF